LVTFRQGGLRTKSTRNHGLSTLKEIRDQEELPNSDEGPPGSILIEVTPG
jgi:hypothetical protein